MESKDYQKRVAAIHDLSGFGKCSLTVALPIPVSYTHLLYIPLWRSKSILQDAFLS